LAPVKTVNVFLNELARTLLWSSNDGGRLWAVMALQTIVPKDYQRCATHCYLNSGIWSNTANTNSAINPSEQARTKSKGMQPVPSPRKRESEKRGSYNSLRGDFT